MKSNCYLLIVTIVAVAVVTASAERPHSRGDADEVMKSLHGLEWEDVDFEKLSPLQRCRTLMLLNHALGEVGGAAIAEADLMTEFIDQRGLREAFAASPVPVARRARTFDEGCKMAAALLAGPMSNTRYATALAHADDDGVNLHIKMYDRECRSKWDKFTDPVRDVRRVAAFLKTQGIDEEYMAWARIESERREKEYRQEMANRRAEAGARTKEEEAKRRARAAEREEQRRQEAETFRAQQALYAFQMAQAAAAAPRVVVVDDDDDDEDWYLGWYHGAVANPHNHSWHRRKGYQSQVRERARERIGGGGHNARSEASGTGLP